MSTHLAKLPQPSNDNDSPIEAYKVDKDNVGKALIVNIKHYSGDKKPFNLRAGSEKDVESMRKVFQKLGFKVQVTPTKYEGTKGEVEKILKDFASSDNHVGMSMTAVCIMAHGDDGYFCTSDKEKIFLEDVYELFNGDKCQSLNGKPKLFFIQACRGTQSQGGGKIVADSQPIDQPLTAVCAHFVVVYATIRKNVAYKEVDKIYFAQCITLSNIFRPRPFGTGGPTVRIKTITII